ncbi:pyridoxal phosphate-dependent aminotransferase [Halobacterium litoreum]|uniref:Pyridoxal phosphate-dependent aminotransferase n=1 Tax=Halobacterium litoreum TaxID=2039234 RepID=A0ABD5NB79_9EURY|nr:pyridoxal phosphate-dependent aminotransferase [Halobacterium litoreum]UHH12001.1 pyridoxal phosphate-dependent aminotransferase [Halobacterium litoreum]
MFPRLEYLEWISGRPEVALYDLGSSDLRGDRDHDPVVVPERLDGLSDPPTGASLETQIAGEYGVHPEQVLVTPGASTANFVAAAAALYPDPDEDWTDAESEASQPTALVEKPGYEPLVKAPAAVGADVDRFLREDDYRLDPERAENALTDTTRLVTVTNRHNPSGRLADRETLADLAERVDDAGARLLVDEVYAPFGTESVDGAFGGPTAAGLDATAITGSLTKFHGLGDVRVGWLVADREFVDRARSVAYHVPGMSGPGRALGMRALHNRDALAKRSRDLIAENHALLAEFVDARDDVDGVVPEGSTYAFLDPANVDGDELAAAAWEEGVLVVPGRFFDDPERVRVSLGRDPDQMAAALDALGAVLGRQ